MQITSLLLEVILVILRIRGSADYFKKYVPLNKSLFSIEANEEINEITMPKTMKQLFCWICMTYDCG